MLIRNNIKNWKRLDTKCDLIRSGRVMAIEVDDLAIMQVYMPVANGEWDEIRQHYEGIAAIMHRYNDKK